MGSSKGVGSNSIQCSSCQKWVHKKCGIKGCMSKVAKSVICSGCLSPVTSAGHTGVDIGASAKLELVDKFCCLCVLLDSRPTFVPHIRRISGRCSYHLR